MLLVLTNLHYIDNLNIFKMNILLLNMKENLYMIVFIIISSCKILNSKSYEYLSVIHPNCDILDGADICYVKTFQATCIDNMYYINWIAISNSEKFIYSVEKSFDGKHFKQIYFKKGQ